MSPGCPGEESEIGELEQAGLVSLWGLSPWLAAGHSCCLFVGSFLCSPASFTSSLLKRTSVILDFILFFGCPESAATYRVSLGLVGEGYSPALPAVASLVVDHGL